jgi:4'-phosphopantetheinyl transferase EntD
MIEKILPGGIASAEAFHDTPGDVLFPEEEASVARAVAKRRGEFTTARACARRALEGLGLPPAPIPRGERGAPQWPPGITGSITHCAGYRAAAVAWSANFAAIGIDAEPNGPLPDGVLNTISLPSERRMLSELAEAEPGISWDRILFCAKETVYKAWFPLARRWLGFEDAEFVISATDGSFGARILVPVPEGAEALARDSLPGRWLMSDGLVVTAMALPGSRPELPAPPCANWNEPRCRPPPAARRPPPAARRPPPAARRRAPRGPGGGRAGPGHPVARVGVDTAASRPPHACGHRGRRDQEAGEGSSRIIPRYSGVLRIKWPAL